MNFPTLAEVEAADHVQLARWYRFLPGVQTEEELLIINRVVLRFLEMGGMTPEISKLIGLKAPTS